MKKNIITFLVLILVLVLAGYAARYIIDFGKDIAVMADLQDANTGMLLVQAEVKSIKDEVILKSDESLYKGEKLETSEKDFSTLYDNKIISREGEHFNKFYIWDNNTLQELDIDVILSEGEYYIVNYETLEVITTEGVIEPENNEAKYVINEVINIVEKETNIIE